MTKTFRAGIHFSQDDPSPRAESDTAPSPPHMSVYLQERAKLTVERLLAHVKAKPLPVADHDEDDDDDDDRDYETAPSPPHMSVFFREQRLLQERRQRR